MILRFKTPDGREVVTSNWSAVRSGVVLTIHYLFDMPMADASTDQHVFKITVDEFMERITDAGKVCDLTDVETML